MTATGFGLRRRFWWVAARAWLAAMSALAAAPAAATSYTFITSGTSIDHSVVATDVNDAGTVVGYQFNNLTSISTGFMYAAGVKTDVTGPSGAISTDLSGITSSGVGVGNYATTLVDDGTGFMVPGPTRIFSLSQGVYSDLAIPGLPTAAAIAISGNGRWLVGNTFDDQTGATRGFAFDTLPGGAVTRFNGSATSIIAAGVNNLGVVVGYDRSFVAGVGNVGPAWTFDLASGQRTEFNVVGSVRSAARDISDTGVISGYYFASQRPAVVHGYTGYGGSFEFFDVPSASQTYVLAGNNLGALAGQYLDVDGNLGAFLAVPVPEPGVTGLLVAGLLGLAGLRRAAVQRG